ncbi:MAG: hypothetical protein JO090_16645 [Rhizobacter sp.]|nr:hypothetical protein [Rhizobacter sp.]
MHMSTSPGDLIQRCVEVQRRKRSSLGQSALVFPLQALAELFVDEIRAMRAQGRTDDVICEVLLDATGRKFTPSVLQAVCGGEADGGSGALFPSGRAQLR